MSALAAMMLHARKVLDRDTSSHLVANALTPHVMAEADGLDLGPLPTVLDSLRARVAQDVRIRSAHPSYPYAYPESVDDLLVELAAVWSAYEQGHVPEDPLRALLRAHREDPELSFKVRLEAGRWYVSAWRAGRVIAEDDHHLHEVAVGEVLRLLPGGAEPRSAG
jgi:hypothetical protein